MNNDGGCDNCVQSRVYRPDMGNLVPSLGSSKFTINMDKTPTVVGARKEHFGSIGDMIVHWEGMKCKEESEWGEEESFGGPRRRKRLSKSICELFWRFEEGGEMDDSQQWGVGRGRRIESNIRF